MTFSARLPSPSTFPFFDPKLFKKKKKPPTLRDRGFDKFFESPSSGGFFSRKKLLFATRDFPLEKSSAFFKKRAVLHIFILLREGIRLCTYLLFRSGSIFRKTGRESLCAALCPPLPPEKQTYVERKGINVTQRYAPNP